MAARFTIAGKKYSPGIYYTSPSICAVNTDLFAKYSVKSPVDYYKEGTWDMDNFVKCCKELTRTLADGTKIWGSYWRDATYYLVADDARLVRWDKGNNKLLLTMTNSETVKALNVWAETYLKGYSPTSEQGGSNFFKIGQMGTFVCDTVNLAKYAPDFTFKWDVVPTPLGANNTSGEIPGEVSGNGVVSSTKNPQGVINYCIAMSKWRMASTKTNYGIYFSEHYTGVYNQEQVKTIVDSSEHIGLDLYMGVGNLATNQYGFWNDLKRGTMTIKEVFDTYEGVWQAEVDAENDAAVR